MSEISPQPDRNRIYVLDQNFPALALSADWPPGIAVVRLGEIDPGLVSATDDWEILLTLDARLDTVAFITNDARILDSAREMVALQHTDLTLIATDSVGHNPLKATGLLMVHLADILHDNTAGPMTYRLRPSGRSAERPGAIVNRIAKRRGTDPVTLIRTERDGIGLHLASSRPDLAELWSRRVQT